MKRITVQQAFQKKYPEWIDLVISRSREGRANAMPVGWSTIASGSPVLYAVAIHHRHYTAQLIQETKEFVIAAPSQELAQAVLYCGTHSGHQGDKMGPSGLQLVEAAVVSAPLVAGAVYNLECTLHAQHRTGDHILFVGEVVAAHADEKAGKRLLNFGNNAWARAKMAPDSVFRF